MCFKVVCVDVLVFFMEVIDGEGDITMRMGLGLEGGPSLSASRSVLRAEDRRSVRILSQW